MDLEPSTSSAALPTLAPDADMSLDVADLSPALGAEDDAAMEDDAAREDDTAPLDDEAVMADDSATARDDTSVTGEAVMLDEVDDLPPTSASFDVDIDPLPVSSAPVSLNTSLAPVPASADLGLGDDTLAFEPILTSTPADLPSSVAGIDAPLEEALAAPHFPSTAPVADVDAAPVAVEEVATDEGVAPVLPPASGAAEVEPVLTSLESAASVPVVEDSASSSTLDLTSGASSAAAELALPASTDSSVVEPEAPAEPQPEPEKSAAEPSERLAVDKDPLLPIEVPSQPSTAADPSARGVPPVFLTYDSTTYSLFHAAPSPFSQSHSHSSDSGSGDEEDEPAPTLLLDKPEQHQLYYQPVEKLFRVLREQFGEFADQQDELVLEFDDIGIALSEDNVYSHSVTLFDFDRIHLGCRLPGRLHARLSAQGRFAAGFNALAQHIAASWGVEDEEQELEEDEEGEAEESVTVVAEEGEGEEYVFVDAEGGEDDEEGEKDHLEERGEEPQLDEGEEGEEHDASSDARTLEEGEGAEDDYDGPDSALVIDVHDESHGDDHDSASPSGDGEQDQPSQPDAVQPEADQPEGAEDDFDLEYALAQLDGDDVVAVVEGAQEDYLLSQRREQEEEEKEEQQHEEGAGDGEEQGGEAEEPTKGEEGEAGQDGGVPAAGVEDEVAAPVDQPGHADEPARAVESTDEVDDSAAATQEGEPEPETALPADQPALAEAANQDVSATQVPITAPSVPAATAAAADELPDPKAVPAASGTEPAELVAAEEESVAAEANEEGGEPDGVAVDDEDHAALESAGATATESLDELANAPEEDPADPSDIVIDYDEAFDGSTATAAAAADVGAQPASAPRAETGPTAAPITAAGLDAEKGEEVGKLSPPPRKEDDVEALLSPKRSRESFLDGQDEEGAEGVDGTEAGDVKRQRLDDEVALSSA
ncbi:hypothetical protein JCM8097_004970 [Rhodosporidiobolus ruineniae]